MSATGVRRVGWVLAALGVCGLLGAGALAVSPGVALAPAVPFGERMTVSLAAGEHAVYVTPSDQWRSISCEAAAGSELPLRTGMMQQDLVVPERWDAQGSFDMPEAGVVAFTCDGPVADARFTVGPVVSVFSVLGVGALGVVSLIVTAIGVVLLAIRASRARRG